MKIQRAQTTLLTTESKNFLALLQLSILGLQALMFVFILLIAGRQNQLANRRPTMAQLVNGDTVYISEKDWNWRYPQVIRKLVSDWTVLTFNWEGKIAGTDKIDEGIKVDDRRRVPTNTWFASVLLEDDFAQAALKEIAQLVPADVFTGRIRSVTIVNHISEPRQIAPGRWQVDVVSTRILIDRSTGKSERLPFNRTFTLEAVEIPHSPLGSEAPLVEQKIYETRSAGLQITNIVPFEPKRS